MFRKKINQRSAQFIIWIIIGYQYTLSPDKGLPSLRWKGRICMHEPHCSQYSINVLKRYGFWPGIFYASDRVLHCTGGMHKICDPDHYKVIFFSSDPIGIPFLHALDEDPRFEITGVVTQCDKPAGRGLQICESIIKQEAEKTHTFGTLNSKFGTNFISTPTKLNPEKSQEGRAFANRIQDQHPDFLVVIAYGKIIPQSILDIPKFGAINVHPSLLPKYRGPSPIQSALLHDEKETGITIMVMDADMDTGDMIDVTKFPIFRNQTAQDLSQIVQERGPKFLNDTLWKYGKRLLGRVKQEENNAKYCCKIEKESGKIEAALTPLHEVWNRYRAFALRPKIYFMFNGKRVIIEELTLDETKFKQTKDTPLLQEKTLNPAVLTIKVKPEGKGVMDRKAFANGYIK